jgi:hypothetical protein
MHSPNKNLLDLVAQRREVMFPVHHGHSSGQHQSNIHSGVFESNAAMRSSTENKIIFGIGVSRTRRIQPPFRNKLFGFRVYRWIVKRVKEGWNNHAVGRYGVVIGNWEGSGSSVGNLLQTTISNVNIKSSRNVKDKPDHRHWRFNTHTLSDRGLEINHLV